MLFALHKTLHYMDIVLFAEPLIKRRVCYLQIPVDWCVHSRISGAPILK